MRISIALLALSFCVPVSASAIAPPCCLAPTSQTSVEPVAGATLSSAERRRVRRVVSNIQAWCQRSPTYYQPCMATLILQAHERGEFGPNVRVSTTYASSD